MNNNEAVVVVAGGGWEIGTICSASAAHEAMGDGAIVLPYDETAEVVELDGAASWAVRFFGSKGYSLPKDPSPVIVGALPVPVSPGRATLHYSMGLLPAPDLLGKVRVNGPGNAMDGRFQVTSMSILNRPAARVTMSKVIEPSSFPRLEFDSNDEAIAWNVAGTCTIEAQIRDLCFVGVKGHAPGARLLWLAVSTTL